MYYWSLEKKRNLFPKKNWKPFWRVGLKIGQLPFHLISHVFNPLRKLFLSWSSLFVNSKLMATSVRFNGIKFVSTNSSYKLLNFVSFSCHLLSENLCKDKLVLDRGFEFSDNLKFFAISLCFFHVLSLYFSVTRTEHKNSQYIVHQIICISNLE